MAYGIVHQFPGGTKEQYEASIAAVHPSDGSLPEGQIFHAAGPSADGWTIIAIHDSQESWGTLPRRETDADHVRGHRRRLSHTAARDGLHRSQPADEVGRPPRRFLAARWGRNAAKARLAEDRGAVFARTIAAKGLRR